MPKAKKPSQSGIASALDADEKMIQEKAKQETQNRSSQAAPVETPEPVKRGRGRPKKQGSKRQGVTDGTHVNLNIIIPLDLHEELGLEAFKNKEKDMSDIITELLKKHYKK